MRGTSWLSVIALACGLCASGQQVRATPVALLHQPGNESPVRADPGDLLLLPGYGFDTTDTVVYQALGDTTQPLPTPTSIPTTSNATTGVAPIVSYLNVPHSLVVSLPSVLTTDQSYAIWVVNGSGEWSNGIKINDARPLWLTPDFAYATAAIASLPRYLKVVGRNLQPAAGATTQVRLSGPANYTLTAANDGNPATAIERYVAKITLPTSMPVGGYTVSVSRDGGVSWVANATSFTVVADPATPTQFPVASYGGCAPDDGVDDTPCIVQAIAAASAAGGGSVTFGPGVWEMGNGSQTGVTAAFGVLVPVGVNLVGAGASSTTIQKDTTWTYLQPILTVQGQNLVTGITFKDAYTHVQGTRGAPLMWFGVDPPHAQSYNSPSSVSYVTITQNVFDNPFISFEDGGLPMDHIYITNNEFGDFDTGIWLRNNNTLSDSIIDNNTFDPGSELNGPIATNINAGHRVDFSNNIADGTATKYLYTPSTGPWGFRAGFFWGMQGGNENVLVSQNNEMCTGDNDGDGEAVSLDSIFNFNALPTMEPYFNISTRTIEFTGPLTDANGKVYPDGSLAGMWVTVAQGKGLGQSRLITGHTSPSQAIVTFSVTPGWDVTPDSTSQFVITKQYWHFDMIDNFVDQRTPLCHKANLIKPAGGVLGVSGQMVDSAIEGNQQFDTSGIELGVGYGSNDPTYSVTQSAALDRFIEIRGNSISGEYNYDAVCSLGGIQMMLGADPKVGLTIPIEAFGISISHNNIDHADGFRNGAITMGPSWFTGPPPGTWDLVESALIFNNSISNVNGAAPSQSSQWSSCPVYKWARVGIDLTYPVIWHTVLAQNSCTNVTQNLTDAATRSKRVCTNAGANSCECSYYLQGFESTGTASQASTSIAYQGAQLAGDLNLLVVNWSGTGVQVSSVTDSAGNSYAVAAGPTVVPGSVSQTGDVHQVVYYAKNIHAATSNTVTVTFNSPATGTALRAAEYQGLDPSNPLDTNVGAYGINTTPDSGWVTPNNGNDLLVSAVYTNSTGIAAGPGNTARMIRTDPTQGSDLVEDRTVSKIAAYDATATTVAPTAWWVSQMIALRLAGDGGENTQALIAPTGLTASPLSSTQIQLGWNNSNDDFGTVSNFLVERCQGTGCTNFATVANVTSATAYTDASLSPSTTYTYRVRAYDAAELLSGYTSAVSATTSGP